MVKIVSGPKGSGKTKKLIDMANDDIHDSKGQIVFINDREKYRVKLNNSIRYINADDFYIYSSEILFGFLNGIIAENYDIDIVYIDNLLRITKVKKIDDLNKLFEDIGFLENKYNVKFILSISTDNEEVPMEIEQYVS